MSITQQLHAFSSSAVSLLGAKRCTDVHQYVTNMQQIHVDFVQHIYASKKLQSWHLNCGPYIYKSRHSAGSLNISYVLRKLIIFWNNWQFEIAKFTTKNNRLFCLQRQSVLCTYYFGCSSTAVICVYTCCGQMSTCHNYTQD